MENEILCKELVNSRGISVGYVRYILRELIATPTSIGITFDGDVLSMEKIISSMFPDKYLKKFPKSEVRDMKIAPVYTETISDTIMKIAVNILNNTSDLNIKASKYTIMEVISIAIEPRYQSETYVIEELFGNIPEDLICVLAPHTWDDYHYFKNHDLGKKFFYPFKEFYIGIGFECIGSANDELKPYLFTENKIGRAIYDGILEDRDIFRKRMSKLKRGGLFDRHYPISFIRK